MSVRIIPGDLGDRQVIDLLFTHTARARAETAPGSAHALDLTGLQAPDIRFWTLWEDYVLLGCGALKKLSTGHGEVKSMHVAEKARRRGSGSAILRHIIDAARADGLIRLSLETGSWDYFQAARAFYRHHGFIDCPPFGAYRPDPNSVFLTLELPPDES